MNISTAISVLRDRFGDKKAIELYANAGFKMLDLSLFHMANPTSPFNAEDWENTAKDLRAYADGLGVTFNQAHLPFQFKWNAPDEWERFIGPAHYRALDICGIMGVKYVVAHPIHHMEYLGHEEEVYEYNMRFYRTMIPYCKKYGYKICIENMWQKEAKTRRIGHDSCSRMDELIRYIDGLGGTEYFVACLDLGHTTLVGLEPEDCIRQLGHKYLHSLHVHDNDYISDQHSIPGQGKINWEEVCRALGEIDYDGELTYEASNFQRHFPDDMIPIALKFMVDIGEHLCQKIDSYRPNSLA